MGFQRNKNNAKAVHVRARARNEHCPYCNHILMYKADGVGLPPIVRPLLALSWYCTFCKCSITLYDFYSKFVTVTPL